MDYIPLLQASDLFLFVAAPCLFSQFWVTIAEIYYHTEPTPSEGMGVALLSKTILLYEKSDNHFFNILEFILVMPVMYHYVPVKKINTEHLTCLLYTSRCV